jgi:hypothetical protein
MRHRQAPTNLSRLMRGGSGIEWTEPMKLLTSRPQVAAAVLDHQQDGSAVLTCPMCHTPTSLTRSDIDAGAGWRCVRCGQHWSATRLSTVAAYAASLVERPTVAATGGAQTPRPHSVPTDQQSGKT